MRVLPRQLSAFLRVADDSSFVAAARTLHVTAGALSVVIRSLEQQLGFQLFERTTRRVKLSPAGQLYLPYARRVLNDLEQAASAANSIRMGTLGIVRVSATQGIACTILPRLFDAFRATRPDVRMIPVDTAIDAVTAAVDRGDAEFAIAPSYGVPHSSELESMEIFKSRLHVVCPPSDLFAGRDSVDWSELKSRQIIYMGRDIGLHAIMDPLVGICEVPPLTVDHLTTALGMIASGAGVAVLTDYTAPMLKIHGLLMLPLEKPVVHRQVMLYRRRVHQMLPVAMDFESFVLDAFRDPRGVRQALA